MIWLAAYLLLLALFLFIWVGLCNRNQQLDALIRKDLENQP